MLTLEDFAEFCGELTLDNGRALELQPFQRTMLADYFAGARESLCLLPKGNGKTTLLGALALFDLVTMPDAEIVIAAASRDQAAIMMRQAQTFIRHSAALRARLAVKQREVAHRELGGRIRVLASDVDTGDGVIPTLALVDELHRHRSSELYTILRDGLFKRGGRMVTISTAGVANEGPLWEARQAALERGSQREGAYLRADHPAASFALHEWSLAPGDDADDIEAVKRANPASWITPELLAQRHDSPTTASHDWKRFACNVWTSSVQRWLPEDAWQACAAPGREIPAGNPIVLGFDGSRTDDSTAIVAVSLEARPHVELIGLWEKDPYDARWTVPQDAVLDRLRAGCAHWDVREITADVAFWVAQLEELESVEYLPVVRFVQTGRDMLEATARFHELVLAGDLSHGGDADLDRHVANCTPKYDLMGRVKVNKASQARKIDAAVAAIMAVHRAGRLGVEERNPSRFAGVVAAGYRSSHLRGEGS